MDKLWTDDGWADYIYWQTQDKKTLKKINELIKDIDNKALLLAKEAAFAVALTVAVNLTTAIHA